MPATCRVPPENCQRFLTRLKVNEKADALYFRLDESNIVESEEVVPAVILDFNDQNQVVSVEILSISTRVPKLNLKILDFQAA
ncbi:MAG: DUF2283 domain-containing protein [Phycisphaerae bacterium]